MILYYWKSEALRNYGPGEIVVAADDVEEARRIVRSNWIAWLREKGYIRFCGEPEFEHEHEEYDTWLGNLEDDLRQEPIILANNLWIDSGSD